MSVFVYIAYQKDMAILPSLFPLKDLFLSFTFKTYIWEGIFAVSADIYFQILILASRYSF